MTIQIDLVNPRHAVGYGTHQETGQTIMGFKLTDPESGIQVGFSFMGDDLEQFLAKIKPVSNLKIAGSMPRIL